MDIHKGDIIAWPTNLGWMMGPWLVYASLLNGASMALYNGSPLGSGFAKFVQVKFLELCVANGLVLSLFFFCVDFHTDITS
jgi:acyl-coenzyme A synthetase/AMP-(fatty) acid ligase